MQISWILSALIVNSSMCVTVYAGCIYVFFIKILFSSLNAMLTVDKHCRVSLLSSNPTSADFFTFYNFNFWRQYLSTYMHYIYMHVISVFACLFATITASGEKHPLTG